MAEMVQAVSKSLVSFVTKFPFRRGNIGTPSAQALAFALLRWIRKMYMSGG